MASLNSILLAAFALFAVSTLIGARPTAKQYAVVDDVQPSEKQPTSFAQKLLSSAAQPYASFLFFREGLVDDEMTSQADRVCRSDDNCDSASSFCSQEGICTSTLHVRSRCSRDAMCSSGFCRWTRLAGARCASKRAEGASCRENPSSACADGLFCSLTDKRCKPKRLLNQSCRSAEGCSQGLACINYICQESITPTQTFKDPAERALAAMEKRDFWPPQPSGAHDHEHWFAKREDESDDEFKKRTWWPTPSGNPGFQWFPKRENESNEEYQKRTWWPSPSGNPGSPWFPKRENESNEEYKKRTWWPSPSGNPGNPWFPKREDESDEEYHKRTFWPQPSGNAGNPVWFKQRDQHNAFNEV